MVEQCALKLVLCLSTSGTDTTKSHSLGILDETLPKVIFIGPHSDDSNRTKENYMHPNSSDRETMIGLR